MILTTREQKKKIFLNYNVHVYYCAIYIYFPESKFCDHVFSGGAGGREWPSTTWLLWQPGELRWSVARPASVDAWRRGKPPARRRPFAAPRPPRDAPDAVCASPGCQGRRHAPWRPWPGHDVSATDLSKRWLSVCWDAERSYRHLPCSVRTRGIHGEGVGEFNPIEIFFKIQGPNLQNNLRRPISLDFIFYS